MNAPAVLDEARDPLAIAESWMNEGKEVAIATVETWGRAVAVGSHLVIDANAISTVLSGRLRRRR